MKRAVNGDKQHELQCSVLLSQVILCIAGSTEPFDS